MMVSYVEAKKRALKRRDIWVRRLLCDPVTTPIAYIMAKYTDTSPMSLTMGTFILGIWAAVMFGLGALVQGAILYFLCFLSDSTDGKLNRVLGRDDTHRGIVDFILDGIVCVAVVMGLAVNGDILLVVLLLLWMGIHYLDMRLTSAAYRLKVQFGLADVWLINEGTNTSSNWILRVYGKLIGKLEGLRTYPHPTVGEAVILMFVVGPMLWWTTGGIWWMYAATGLGILCILPETMGAGLIAYVMASNEEVR